MVADPGCESGEVAVGLPDEAQPMQLVLVEGRFFDEAVAGSDCPYDAMFRMVRLPHALALPAVLVRPLVIRGVVAGLHPWERQARADLLPECLENFNGHPICGLPSLNCDFVSTDRLTF